MLVFYALLRHHTQLFLNDSSTTLIYTLSLHDALPICIHIDRPYAGCPPRWLRRRQTGFRRVAGPGHWFPDPARPAAPFLKGCCRSEEHTSELQSREISYAVFCLKKKNNK